MWFLQSIEGEKDPRKYPMHADREIRTNFWILGLEDGQNPDKNRPILRSCRPESSDSLTATSLRSAAGPDKLEGRMEPDGSSQWKIRYRSLRCLPAGNNRESPGRFFFNFCQFLLNLSGRRTLSGQNLAWAGRSARIRTRIRRNFPDKSTKIWKIFRGHT